MERIESIADADAKGTRLDRFLASTRPDASRSAIQREIRDGNVRVAGVAVRQPSYRLRGGETIVWSLREPPSLAPRAIPIDIVYEDDALVVVDKPVGLVVHPGAGTNETTLVEGLLATRNLPASDDPIRPGIVHRLDKPTSGVLVVAKTAAALDALKAQFAARSVAKSYLAVVEGTIDEDEGTIDAPVGRDPTRPSRMAVLPTGRLAQTEFDVLQRLDGRTLVVAHPRTGRTHQLRVHFTYIGHPVVGDDTYGGRSTHRSAGSAPSGAPKGRGKGDDVATSRSAPAERPARLFLHAWRLSIEHPETGEDVRFEAPVPPEFPEFAYESVPWNRIPETA